MEIFVKTPTGQRVGLKLSPSHKILDAKIALDKQIRMDPKMQHLYLLEPNMKEERLYVEYELEDHDTLEFCNILPGSVLHLQSDMKIFVETWDQNLLLTFPAEPFNTIRDIMVEIFILTGVPIDDQRLFWASQRDADGSYWLKVPLKDIETIQSLGFGNAKTLLAEFINQEIKNPKHGKSKISLQGMVCWTKSLLFKYIKRLKPKCVSKP